jgi:small subunit ribosomal protein S1
MSWSKRLQHPSEVVNKGDEVESVVLNVDAENQRLSLGLKQLSTDIWDEFLSNNSAGDVVEGKIVKLTNFGAFVELADGIEGLIHVSEFDDEQGDEKIELEVDQAYSMKIIKLSAVDRKIGLSIRALKLGDEAVDWTSQDEQSSSPEATLGDHFKGLQE